MKNSNDFLNILRSIYKNPNITQRQLAKKLSFSLGKLNYCLKALKLKGFIKINNFKRNSDKISYAYLLTPKGINKKTKLTVNFIKKKMSEYDELKKDLEGR